MPFELGVRGTCPSYHLEFECLFAQESQSGRIFGESVGGIFDLDCSDWLKGLRYNNIDTKPEAKFNSITEGSTYVG